MADVAPQDLEAYLDEALPAAEMNRLEAALRAEPALREQLAEIARQREGGGHTLGEIWRRRQVSCLSREQWGSYLLGALDEAEADYARFHLETIGCRWCQANYDDLASRPTEERTAADARRRRYFESSAGRARRTRDDA